MRPILRGIFVFCTLALLAGASSACDTQMFSIPMIVQQVPMVQSAPVVTFQSTPMVMYSVPSVAVYSSAPMVMYERPLRIRRGLFGRLFLSH